jgi:phosphoribosylaminoimidazolecarboxamide formyltransferase/IMP cyclohydrolase
MADYDFFQQILEEKQGFTDLHDRKELARRAFKVSSHYDTAIYSWFNKEANDPALKISIAEHQVLRYGENPHQQGFFHGSLDELLGKLGGKELSFNNLVDVDAAIALMYDLKDQDPSFVVIKHTNACGVATRPTVLEAWKAALAADPVSAFGGILISNATIDLVTAQAIDELFYEVLLAPEFTPDALELLLKKKNRIVLQIKKWAQPVRLFKRLLNGVVEQDNDLSVQTLADLRWATKLQASPSETADLLFANICVKHLKSNAIALVKNRQLIAMGCGQTSRIDALKAAIAKARSFGFDPEGAVMASDAFFPFPDCVEIAFEAGIKAVIQPGGSVKDQDSIDYCDAHGMAMAMTGTRHFRH